MINLGRILLYLVTVLVTMFFIMGADSIMDKGYLTFFTWLAFDIILIFLCWLSNKEK